MENQTNYSSFCIGRRNIKRKNHWEKLDIKSYKITKPTIICLPGNASIEEKDANAICRSVMGYLGLMYDRIDRTFKIVDVIGFSYGKKEKDSKTGGFSKEEIDEIVDNLLLPLCVSDKGNLLPESEIIANISNITFFSHCKGADHVRDLMINLYFKLLSKGLKSSQIINNIYSQVSHISYAPHDMDCAIVPTVKIFSVRDNTTILGIDDAFKGKGLVIDYIPRGLFDTAYADSVEIISEKLLNASNVTVNEHFYGYLDRNNKWELSNELFKGSKNADIVSQMMAYSIARSVGISIQNYLGEGDGYVFKISIQHLILELIDIKNTYTPEELSIKEFNS